MTLLQPFQLTTAVQSWAEFRNDELPLYWQVRGGYESWVQVDLTAFILRKESTIEISREQHVFIGAREQVDLLVNADSIFGATAGHAVCVMLACQSLDNYQSFVPGILLRLGQLRVENRALRFRESACVMLAIAFGAEAIDALQKLEFEDRVIFHRIHNSSQLTVFMATWEPESGWIPRF